MWTIIAWILVAVLIFMFFVALNDTSSKEELARKLKEDNQKLKKEKLQLEIELNKSKSPTVAFQKPSERIAYKDRIVEKRIEVPVEKIVYKDRIVEKKIEVPVEKVVYVGKDTSDEAAICLDDIKKEADNILNSAFDNAEKIIDDAKEEAQKLLLEATEKKREAELLIKENEHFNEDRSRILDILQAEPVEYLLESDWQLKVSKDELKRIDNSNELFSRVELITDWEIKDGTYISDSSIRKLLNFCTLYCDILVSKIAANCYKKGLSNTLQEAYIAISNVEKLIPWQFSYKISDKYIERKRKQIELIYEIEEYKARKKEEQRLLKEQQREEAAAQREFERELKKAQKDKAKAQEALLKAQEEAEKEKENTDKFNKLQEQIASLQAALEEAQQRSERVMSMAQQTRQGWVYIISNIGSFGEDVYKIGMTRRLDPMERVAELGDASVPFPFDVHAMIFSEDAPALETALHHAFEGNRTNLINGKKEFFNVSLSSIKEKVKELGYDVMFEDNAIAPQYRDSLFARSHN